MLCQMKNAAQHPLPGAEPENGMHQSDTMEEKLSLVNRFGVKINYSKPMKKEFNHIFYNKDEFNEKFKKYLNRDYIILNGKNENEFKKFLKNKTVIFCKPISGTHGALMEKIVIKDFKGNLYDYLYNKKDERIFRISYKDCYMKGHEYFCFTKIINSNDIIQNLRIKLDKKSNYI